MRQLGTKRVFCGMSHAHQESIICPTEIASTSASSQYKCKNSKNIEWSIIVQQIKFQRVVTPIELHAQSRGTSGTDTRIKLIVQYFSESQIVNHLGNFEKFTYRALFQTELLLSNKPGEVQFKICFEMPGKVGTEI